MKRTKFKMTSILLIVLVLQSLVLLSTVVGFIATKGTIPQWAPLGEYTDQRTHRDTYFLNEKNEAIVTVSGSKCAKEDVKIVGSASWISTDPIGSIVPLSSNQATTTRFKGCTEFLYKNPVPLEVARQTELLGGKVEWRITGVEVPVGGTREGVPATWTTNKFTVITYEHASSNVLEIGVD